MKKYDKFTNYSPKVRDFFEELSKNNNKEWFDENREFYEEQIRDKSKSLVQDMGVRFAELGLPYMADIRRSVFRINRDIRFSNNKDPYKTNLGVFFPYSVSQTGKKPIHALGLYFHIDNNESFIAGGIHSPSTENLNAIRQRLAEDWQEFESIINNKEFKRQYPGELWGDSLKRMPRGFSEDHPAADLIKRKQFVVTCDVSFKDATSERLMKIMEEKAVALTNFLEYFRAAIEG